MTEIIQGSPEWHETRLGKVTASRVSDVIAKTRSGWGASRANYAAELVAERLTGTVAETFTSSAMARGNEVEPQARAAYEFLRDGQTIQTVGFVDHPRIAMVGASPDGLVGETGLIEIKCPNTSTHIATLLDSKIPKKYMTQMQFQMACTGRAWCDFVSFDPRLPPKLSFFSARIERDDALIDELEQLVIDFQSEVEETIKQLSLRYDVKEAVSSKSDT